MTPNTIGIDEKGIFCYEAPEKPTEIPISDNKEFEMKFRENADATVSLAHKLYVKLLEAAKRDRVYFKNQQSTINLIRFSPPYNINHEQGKSYPIPYEYEVKIMYRDMTGEHEALMLTGKEYAILVPKEKVDFSQFEGRSLFRPKQQSIEDKWCDSCGQRTTWINGECENYVTAIPQKQQSIEEEAEEWVADGEFGSPLDVSGEWMARKLKMAYIEGAKTQTNRIKDMLSEQLQIHRNMISKAESIEKQEYILQTCDVLSYIRILFIERSK